MIDTDIIYCYGKKCPDNIKYFCEYFLKFMLTIDDIDKNKIKKECEKINAI